MLKIAQDIINILASAGGTRLLRRGLLGGCLGLLMANPVSAHKLLLSYWLSDGEVVGEIGLSNGTFAKGADIEVSQANGELITIVRSDDNGLFRYRPQVVEPHRFFADLGSGHIAKFTVSAEEIEAGKSGALMGGSGIAASGGQALPEEVLRARVPMPNSGIAATDQNAIKGLIRQELTPLRREIIALREKNGLQSILGGIGYIVGLFGLAFFWMGRKAAKAAQQGNRRQTGAASRVLSQEPPTQETSGQETPAQELCAQAAEEKTAPDLIVRGQNSSQANPRTPEPADWLVQGRRLLSRFATRADPGKRQDQKPDAMGSAFNTSEGKS